MQVVLSHGYFLADDPKEQRIMRPYPPLGLLYLSAWLERHGVQNEVFDTTFSSFSTQQEILLERRPAWLALYVNLMTKTNIIRLMRWVRQMPAFQHTRIVLGGPDVTHNVAEYLGAGADFIVIGEGEQTLLELVMYPQELWETLPGIAFFKPNGSLCRTPAREKLRQLDELPLPARHKIDLGQYLDAWKKAHGQSAVSVSTQRGCPYTCRWCSTAVYGQSYRRRSPAAVVEEIRHLQQTYDFDLIWFVDDVFTVSHQWLSGFRQALEQAGVCIRFECITRADRLTEAVLDVLRDCGCFRVWIGAESGSQRIIDAMDRRVQVQQVRDMIRAARQRGIQAGTFIMLGYPGETEADIFETVRHLQESGPDLFTITVAYPIRGTGLYEEVEGRLLPALPWEERSDRDLDFPRSYPRRYYDYAVRFTVNAVYWRQAWQAGRWWRPGPLKTGLKALAARAGMYFFKKNSSV
jgi:anaerobic magnesium-protoporphyrin IX monomethyl ester cyclase